MKAIDGFDPNRDHSKMPFQFDMLFNMTSTLLDIHTVCPYVIVGILLLRKAFKPAGPDGERLWWCTDQKALQKIKNDPLRNICGKAQVDLIPTNHVDLDEHTEAYLQ